jgi:hypothetical protein
VTRFCSSLAPLAALASQEIGTMDDDEGEDDITLPDDLPEPQRSQFIALQTQCQAKFAAAVSLVAAHYGLGSPLELPADKLDDLRDEVAELVDNWDDAEVEKRVGNGGTLATSVVIEGVLRSSEQLMVVLDEAFPPGEDED